MSLLTLLHHSAETIETTTFVETDCETMHRKSFEWVSLSV